MAVGLVVAVLVALVVEALAVGVVMVVSGLFLPHNLGDLECSECRQLRPSERTDVPRLTFSYRSTYL